MRYENPVLPGFHPDPSICRRGGNFYLATSTFHYFPGIALYTSRNLVDWTPIGHCLTRPSQVPLEGANPSGGVFAATLRYHDGRFYAIHANHTAGRRCLVRADDPAGPWSEPIWLEQEGCDPSLFFDDDGRAYYTHTGPGGICQSEMEIATGKQISPMRCIWGGCAGPFLEGPHLYRRGGWYYLVAAEGGTHLGHRVTVARSESPWGPFAPCPGNPVLTHRDRGGHPFQALGHADLVEDAAGRWWCVCLGIRPVGRWHHLGRETFLAPVTWTDDCWPVLGDGGKLEPVMDAPLPAAPAGRDRAWRDEFDGPALAYEWNALRNPSPEMYSLEARPGWLRLHGTTTTLDDTASPAFLGRRQQDFACEASCRMAFEPTEEGQDAGLCVLMDERHYVALGVTRSGAGRCARLRRRIGSLTGVEGIPVAPEGPLVLRLETDGKTYAFAIEDAEGAHALDARAEARYLSTEAAHGFTGVYLGFYAEGREGTPPPPADFDWFAYRGAEC
jgi:xylan 1,4-beta-xylosidase